MCRENGLKSIGNFLGNDFIDAAAEGDWSKFIERFGIIRFVDGGYEG